MVMSFFPVIKIGRLVGLSRLKLRILKNIMQSVTISKNGPIFTPMLLLGIDLGTSSVKVAVTDAQTHQLLATAQFPDTEAPIVSRQPGWAEQSPETWWQQVKQALARVNATGFYDPHDIAAIGIAYQMHGLVLVDKEHR